MTITGASVLEFRRKLDGRSWNPSTRWSERRAPLLVLRADDGSAGIGEAWSRQSEIGCVLRHLAEVVGPGLIGRNVDDGAPSLADAGDATRPDLPEWVAPAAASAVDIALWDLRGKRLGLPVWRLLAAGNTTANGNCAVYASGGLYRDGATSADLARELAGYVEEGFTAVKMKIGGLALRDDIGRVRAARDAIGPAVTLWVDAVNQLTEAAAMTWCEALAECGVSAIQAPVAFADVGAMARINRDGLPVIAAEGEHHHERFDAMLRAKAVTYLQFCLGLCGGFGGGARLDAMAAAFGIGTTPQCFSTAILQAASLHFGAARGNVTCAEYHRFHDHLAGLLPAPMRTIVAGRVHLDDTPGLGLGPVTPGPQPGGGEIITYAQVGAH
jgi:L-alanine-DL-glutamate epimerase-like enolase superfamily enzyme